MPSPVRIANFDALQTVRATDVRIQWPPISGASASDFLDVSVRDSSGGKWFSTPDNFSVNSTSTVASGLPSGDTLTGALGYSRLGSLTTANAGATFVGTIAGFNVKFPLMRVDEPPPIIRQPKSQLVANAGTLTLSVTALGATSYQWKKDGAVLAGGEGPSVTISPVKAADAGSYTVEVSNYAGRRISQPAVVALAPDSALTSLTGPGRGTGDGPLATAQFYAPTRLALGSDGTVFVVDGNAVRKISGGVVSTLAGVPDQSGFADGSGPAARFNSIQGIAVDVAGTIFVGDTGNRCVRRITPDGNVSTLAVTQGKTVGPVAVDEAGNLYLGDPLLSGVSKLTPAGVLSPYYMALQPTALCVDFAGNLFVGSAGSVLKVAPSGTATFCVGGAPISQGSLGGVGTSVHLGTINSLAQDAAGDLLIGTDNGVWMLTPSLVARHVRDGSAMAVAMEPGGTFLVADPNPSHPGISRGSVNVYTTDSRVQITAPPRAQTLAPGSAVALHVDAVGPSLSYQWMKNGAPIAGAIEATLLLQRVTESADYAVIVGNANGAVTTQPARVTPSPGVTPSRIVNLSLRAVTGTQTFILGFVVDGAPASQRRLLVRGVGPGLQAYGVRDAVADPRLTVYASNGAAIGVNEDWNGAREIADAADVVGAFQLVPGSKDAAMVMNVAPASYSVQVNRAGAGSGTALAEVYDAGAGSAGEDSRLINVSARAFAGTGGRKLAVGFVIAGPAAKTVLVRAIGPGLSSYGVAGVLANPTLELYAGQAKIAENDDWSGGAVLRNAFVSSGAFSLSELSHDAALVTTLEPGNYSVVVSGLPFTDASQNVAMTGAVLIEIYEVQ
jgi:hypothetical protein